MTVENGQVVELSLENDGLSGVIPAELGNLSGLVRLILKFNSLTGSIPPALENLSNLEWLLLDGNRFSGSIPAELANLANLTLLGLGGNQLSGSIPVALSGLANLWGLYLWGNQLTGEIPAELGNLTTLHELDLLDNQLTGEIPSTLGNLTELERLLLFSNRLSGSIPPELGNLHNLRRLELEVNQLSGPIPPSLGNLVQLEQLQLQENQLTGELPSSLGNLNNLVHLSLYFNDLAGPVPAEIGNLTKLTWLDLGDNDFSGVLPSSLANLNLLVGLFVGGNNLEGAIPIGNLTLLEEVWLQNNAFDELPDLSNLTALRVLLVNNNRLTFEDLETNIGIPTEAFDYGGQGNVGQAETLTLDEGDPLPLSVAVGGANNHYQWFKDEVPLPSATEDTFTLTFTAAEDAGTYTLQITNTRVPDLTLVSEPITVAVNEEPAFNQAFPFAMTPEAYRMVSIPLDLADASVQAVLEDDLGAYDPQAWRLFRWNESRDDYDEYPAIATMFTPGTAFWLITRDGTGFDVDEANTVHRGRPYAITLSPGWNQIGCPFPFAISWDSISGIEGVEAPVSFEGVEYQYDQRTLKPWEGYFVYNTTSDPVTLEIPPVAATTAQKQATTGSRASKAVYAVQLLATEENFDLRNTQTFVGFAGEAKKARDRLDATEAPGIGDFLRVTATDTGEDLAASFKPLNAEGQWWDIEVEAVIERELIPLRKHVKIAIEEHGVRPPGFNLYVLDRDTERLIATGEGTFTLEVSPDAAVRHLRVIVGTRRFAEQHREAASLVPLNFMLAASYPNPFNVETTIRYQVPERGRVVIEVFNLLGQRVRTLVDNEVIPGTYEVVWDATNDARQPVASGTYVYRMRAGSFTDTRRLLRLH